MSTNDLDVDPENVGFKDIHYNGKPVTRDGLRDDTKQPEGYKAKSFKGIPIAIEWHNDGSVTLAKEVVEQIRATGNTSLLIPPPPGTMYLMNGMGAQDDQS